jgi:hypothetical protein
MSTEKLEQKGERKKERKGKKRGEGGISMQQAPVV